MVEPLVIIGLLAPFAALVLLGGALLVGVRPSERATGPLVAVALGVSLVCFLGAFVPLLAGDRAALVIAFGRWFAVEHAAFELQILVDPLALTFAVLTVAVGGVVAAFSHRYLHHERGYHRYFVLFAMFIGGMLLVVLAGTIEMMLAGWELIGIGAAMLVAFFHERAAPVRNALRIIAVYRIGDAAMLAAAILVHHELGSGSLAAMMTAPAESTDAVLGLGFATIVGLLLVLAAAVKCAQLPFSGWLPRAMEGPTPSSAVFYGALSVHAGAYLMLRTAPAWQASVIASATLGLLGAATALYATLVGRVQTDIKSALAYGSLTQVSIVLVEIAIGLRVLPVVHMIGHALLRLLQFLRAPSLLHDLHTVENAIGHHVGRTGVHLERIVPERVRWWLYRFALERGYCEAWLDKAIVGPFLRLFSALDRLERRAADRIAGEERRGA